MLGLYMQHRIHYASYVNRGTAIHNTRCFKEGQECLEGLQKAREKLDKQKDDKGLDYFTLAWKPG